MKRLVGLAILGAALGAASAAAQSAGQGPPEGQRGNRGEALIEYLGLNAEQQQQWRTLHEQHREEVKALFEEGRALRQRVQKSLEADEPEVVVGKAVKAAYAHRQRLQKEREAFEGQLKALLNQEQKQKFEAFEAARKVGGKGRPGRGHRRGGRPGRGPAPPVEG